MRAACTNGQRKAAADQRVRERQGHPQPAGKLSFGCSMAKAFHKSRGCWLTDKGHGQALLPGCTSAWTNLSVVLCILQILSKMSRVLGVTLKKNPGKK